MNVDWSWHNRCNRTFKYIYFYLYKYIWFMNVTWFVSNRSLNTLVVFLEHFLGGQVSFSAESNGICQVGVSWGGQTHLWMVTPLKQWPFHRWLFGGFINRWLGMIVQCMIILLPNRWWLHVVFYVHSYLGKISNLIHIFRGVETIK